MGRTVYLPTFTIQINQMQVNTPYIECLGSVLQPENPLPNKPIEESVEMLSFSPSELENDCSR